MAVINQYNQVTNTAKIPVDAVLLLNVTGNTDGSWKFAGVDAPTLVSVEGVGGSFTATVEIHGSTQQGPPADSDNSRVLLWSVTSKSDSFSVPQGWRYLKARVTGYAGGTIYAGIIASG